MSDQLEARIRKLEDFQDITNLQAQYSHYVDSGQMEKLIDLFSEDFSWEVGFDKMVTFNSKPELLKYVKQADEGTVLMRHQVQSPVIKIDGDTAKATWYMFGPGTSKTPDGEEGNWTQGIYNNEYVREDGEWKISLLHFKFDFRATFDDGWVGKPMIREEWARRK